jgi:hypothetical protein
MALGSYYQLVAREIIQVGFSAPPVTMLLLHSHRPVKSFLGLTSSTKGNIDIHRHQIGHSDCRAHWQGPINLPAYYLQRAHVTVELGDVRLEEIHVQLKLLWLCFYLLRLHYH